MTAPLLLASGSPRRRQILSLLGLPFEVCVSPIDEEACQQRYHGPNEGLAQWLAREKALAAHTLPEARNALVITADTTVLLDGQILGKPDDEAHARQLLLSLRNRWHQVVTGVCASRRIDGRIQLRSASCATPVLMRPYSEEDIAAYVATGDPLDKAGGYGIQHPEFQPTERINGCYFNVVGLPLCVLVNLLAEFSAPIHAAGRPQGSSLHARAGTSPAPTAQGHKDTACPWSERCKINKEV